MPKKVVNDSPAESGVRKNVDVKSDRLRLAESIHGIVQNMSGFQKAYEEFQKFNEDTINNFDRQLSTKQKEFEDYNRNMESEYENKKIEMEQAFKRDKWKAAIDVLEEDGCISVKQTEYDRIVSENTSLQANHNQILVNVEKEYKANIARETKLLEERLNLEKQAEIAKLQAQFDQKVSEVKRLEDMIDKSYKEIEAQRALTREVSQAASQSRVTVNSGGSK